MRRTAEAATRRRRWTMLTDGGAGSGAQSVAGPQGVRGSPGCGLSAPGHVGPGHTRRGVDRGAAGRGAAPRAPTNPKRKHAYTKFSRKEKEFEGKRASRGSGRGVRAASAAAEPGPLVLPPLATLAAHGHGKAACLVVCEASQVSSSRSLRSQRRLFCALVCAAAGAPSRGVAVPRRAASTRAVALLPSRRSACARSRRRSRTRSLAPSRSFASCAPPPRRGNGRGAPPPRHGHGRG